MVSSLTGQSIFTKFISRPTLPVLIIERFFHFPYRKKKTHCCCYTINRWPTGVIVITALCITSRKITLYRLSIFFTRTPFIRRCWSWWVNALNPTDTPSPIVHGRILIRKSHTKLCPSGYAVLFSVSTSLFVILFKPSIGQRCCT